MQQTLVLLKPDAIERGLAGEILARFESAQLRVVEARLHRPTLALLEQHYADLRQREERAFVRTTRSLAGQPFLALILEGPNAIRKVRALTGPTEPLTAPAGTIRGDFSAETIAEADAENRAVSNLVHAADSVASVQKERDLWFPARAD
jgi:nucleoside-diphosphate kinase